MDSSLLEKFSVVLVLTLILSQVGLATRALLMEMRDGLRRSWRRLGLAVLVFLVASGVTLGYSRQTLPLPILPVRESSVPEPGPELARLEREREALYRQLEELDQRIRQLNPRPVVRQAQVPLISESEAPMRMSLLLGLCLVGFASLVMLGDPTTLLPRLWGRRIVSREERFEMNQAAQKLEALALAAQEGRYLEAREVGDRIREELLDSGDQIDLLFLRGFCLAQLAAQEEGADKRRTLLLESSRILEALLSRAPHLEAAEYLQAWVHGLLGEHEKALEGFRRAREHLDVERLHGDHNESACLLALAQQRLAQDDAPGANQLFEEATALGMMVDQIPLVLVENRLLTVRSSFSGGRFDEAVKGLALLRQVEGIPEQQRKQLLVTCDAFEVIIAFKRGEGSRALEQTRALLGRILPPGLPAVTDEAADEDLEPVLRPETLEFPRELYRTLFFLEAILMTRMEAARGQHLSVQQAEEISIPLLRVFQLEPRNREALAAFGALAYWFIPRLRQRGLAWIRSAVLMGVRSATARSVLKRDGERESDRQGLLQHFLGASARFLLDPTIGEQLRAALVEELGRFQDFAPVLVDLDQRVDSEPRSPSVQMLRERAHYIEGLMADLGTRKNLAPIDGMSALHGEYSRVVESLDVTVKQLTQLDRRVISEIGKLVLTRGVNT